MTNLLPLLTYRVPLALKLCRCENRVEMSRLPKIKRLTSQHHWALKNRRSRIESSFPCGVANFPCPAIHPLTKSRITRILRQKFIGLPIVQRNIPSNLCVYCDFATLLLLKSWSQRKTGDFCRNSNSGAIKPKVDFGTVRHCSNGGPISRRHKFRSYPPVQRVPWAQHVSTWEVLLMCQ